PRRSRRRSAPRARPSRAQAALTGAEDVGAGAKLRVLRVEQTLVESTLDVDSRLDEEPSTGRARDPHRLHLGVGVTERLHWAEQAGTRADNRVIGYAGRAGQDHAARIADRPREAIGQI